MPRFAIEILILATLLLIACGEDAQVVPLTVEEALATDSQPVDQAVLDALLADSSDTAIEVAHMVTFKADGAATYAAFEAAIESLRSAAGGRLVVTVDVLAAAIGASVPDVVRVVRYPSATAYANMIQSQEYRIAARMERNAVANKTLLYGTLFTLPIPESTGSFEVPEFSGLTEEEANDMIEERGQGNDEANRETFVQLLVDDSGESFFMVNLLDYRDEAQYTEEQIAEDESLAGLTGMEADGRYNAVVFPELLSRNSGPHRIIDVTGVLVADNPNWERWAIVRYASPDAIMDMVFDPDFQAGSFHKFASLEDTSAWVTRGAAQYPTDE